MILCALRYLKCCSEFVQLMLRRQMKRLQIAHDRVELHMCAASVHARGKVLNSLDGRRRQQRRRRRLRLRSTLIFHNGMQVNVILSSHTVLGMLYLPFVISHLVGHFSVSRSDVRVRMGCALCAYGTRLAMRTFNCARSILME